MIIFMKVQILPGILPRIPGKNHYQTHHFLSRSFDNLHLQEAFSFLRLFKVQLNFK